MKPTLLVIATLLAASVGATPFVPSSDDEVLETLPERSDPALASLKRLHAATRAHPNDLSLATTFARRAIEASRASGDPRYLGQARAALGPWWARSDAPRDAVLLRATVKQSLHDFPGALDDLDRLLAATPSDQQARLTRATVRNVLGRHADAIADCDALARTVSPLVVAACRSDIASRAGRSAQAYELIVSALAVERAEPTLRAWAATIAAEIAERRGDARGAEQHFRLALALDPKDPYTLGAFADFLIAAGRPREAATLVAPHTRNDALLLRQVLALRHTDAAAFEQRRAELALRIDAARRRGDGVHLREEARYALHVENDAARALRIALANWSVQREPADLRMLAEAARASGDRPALRTVAAWLRESGLEDVRIAALLAGGA